MEPPKGGFSILKATRRMDVVLAEANVRCSSATLKRLKRPPEPDAWVGLRGGDDTESAAPNCSGLFRFPADPVCVSREHNLSLQWEIRNLNAARAKFFA